MRLFNKPLIQEYINGCLKSSVMKNYGRYGSEWFMTSRSTNINYVVTSSTDHTLICDLFLNWTALPNLTFIKCWRFQLDICNWCDMPTEDIYSYGHLVPILRLAYLPTLRPIHPKPVFVPEFRTFVMLKIVFGTWVYELKRVKGETNFVSSVSKVLEHPPRLKYDPDIIEGTIGFVSLHIYTFVLSRACMAGAASQAGDADSSRAPGLTSGLQGSTGVHRRALLLVPHWQCISSFVFYIFVTLVPLAVWSW